MMATNTFLRESDIVCRWGGEEFLIVVKGTGSAQGQALAEKIRGAVANSKFLHQDKVIPVTISLGVASYVDGETPEQLVGHADKALYETKNAGRNRVCVAA